MDKQLIGIRKMIALPVPEPPLPFGLNVNELGVWMIGMNLMIV